MKNLLKNFHILLFFILLLGCTRSTQSGDVASPPTAARGTSMLTLVTVHTTKTQIPQFTSTSTGQKKVPTRTVGTLTTKIPSKTSTIGPTRVTPGPKTGTPPPTPTTKLPGGVPLDAWMDIPIMPGTVTGDEEDDRYRFMLNATVDEVSDFYKKELIKSGWKFDAQGTGENGAPIFIFSKSGSILGISVIVLGDVVVVTLAFF